MKNLCIILIMSLFHIGCNNDDDVTETPEDDVEVSLLGTWQFIEFRASSDTGPFPDGGPSWDEVESDNTITFYPDSTITSNSGSLCSVILFMGSEPTSGLYNLADSTYVSEDCVPFDEHNFPFVQTDSILVITYITNGLLEGKYKKIADLEE